MIWLLIPLLLILYLYGFARWFDKTYREEEKETEKRKLRGDYN